MFESEDDAYSQYASTPVIAEEANSLQHDDSTSSAATAADVSDLSPPTQLLVRLIRENDFEAATTVLTELKALHTPLNELLPDFAPAALWAIRNGKSTEMIYWMRLCPGYIPGTKRLETASQRPHKAQLASVASCFRKCFVVLLDSYGDDLRLLHRASLLAAEKGMWSVLQSTLAQILRFGIGNVMGPVWSNSILGWQYFTRLLQANQSQRGLKDERRREVIKAATLEIRAMYNLGIRTLALAGRLDDAIYWAQKSIEAPPEYVVLAQNLKVDPFTKRLLIEELIRAGVYLEQAYLFGRKFYSVPKNGEKRRMVNEMRERIEQETAHASAAKEHDFTAARSESVLDQTIQSYLKQGDIVTARDHLLSVLGSASQFQYSPDEPMPAGDAPYADNPVAVLEHLPSARTLSELQDLAFKFGTVPVTASLTETDMNRVPASDGSHETSFSQEMMTAQDFLRPVRSKLLLVRGGKGLWETARLYGFIKKGKWKDAILFYIGKDGFRLPAGGISMELVSLVLDQQSLTNASRYDLLDKARWMRGKNWPSTHAINLMLKAIVSICVEGKDYSRLTRVYQQWREASLPNKISDEHSESGHVGELVFGQWPPSQRPDSYTFDPFIRAFGRLNIEVESGPTSSTAPSALEKAGGPARAEKQPWGSSQAVMDVIRDMTDIFFVRPNISTWTIALECLAREGRSRWTTTTSVLARAVGINTASPLSSSYTTVQSAEASFAPANSATYTALMRALIRVSHQDGGSMVEEAAAVRDDLLARTLELDVPLRQMAPVDAHDEDDDQRFWSDLLKRWHVVQEAILAHGGATLDDRSRWQGAEMITANGGRTIETMRELWVLESARETDSDPRTM